MKLKTKQRNRARHYSCQRKFKVFSGCKQGFLEFQFAKTIPQTFEELDELFSNPDNTSKITLNEGETSYIHDNYTLKVQMALIPVIVTPATDSSPEVVEERYSFIMEQKT